MKIWLSGGGEDLFDVDLVAGVRREGFGPAWEGEQVQRTLLSTTAAASSLGDVV